MFSATRSLLERSRREGKTEKATTTVKSSSLPTSSKATTLTFAHLYHAIECNDLETVQNMLQNNGTHLLAATVLTGTPAAPHKRTALHVACEKGHVLMVQCLLNNVNGYHHDNDKGSNTTNKINLQMAVEAKDKQGYTALHIASRKGHLKIVRILIEDYHANVQAVTKRRETALDLAQRSVQVDVVAYLQNYTSSRGSSTAAAGTGTTTAASSAPVDDAIVVAATALHQAIEGNRLVEVRRLVEERYNGHDLVQAHIGPHQRTALHVACSQKGGSTSTTSLGKIDIVQYLIETGGADVEATEAFGRTPLHIAVYHNCIDVVHYLIVTCRANIEARNTSGSTALHFACFEGHLTLVQRLVLDYGADINAVTNSQQTPRDFAQRRNHVDVLDFMDDWFDKVNRISGSGTGSSSSQGMYRHSRDGNSSEHCPYENATPTIRSSSNNNDSPDHSSATDSFTKSPLQRAIEQNDLAGVIDWTERPGANVNGTVQIDTKWTALHLACDRGHVEIVQYLVETCHASVDTTDALGQTALHVASRRNHIEIVQALTVSQSLSTRFLDEIINAADNNGFTALHYASSNGYLELVQWLVVDCRANIRAVDNMGRTPLDLATLHCQGFALLSYLQAKLGGGGGGGGAVASNTTAETNRQAEPEEALPTEKAEELTPQAVPRDDAELSASHDPPGTLPGTLPPSLAIVAVQDAPRAVAGTTSHDPLLMADRRDPLSSLTSATPNAIPESNTRMVEVGTISSLSESTTATAKVVDTQGHATETRNPMEPRPVVSPLHTTNSIESPSTAPGLSLPVSLPTSAGIASATSDASPFSLVSEWQETQDMRIEEFFADNSSRDNPPSFSQAQHDLLLLMIGDACASQEEEDEKQAILASREHAEFYVLLARKLYCMIRAFEVLSTGMVTRSGGSLRSLISDLLLEGNSSECIKKTSVGAFLSDILGWGMRNVASIPFLDSAGSICQLFLTLKDERDRHLAVAQVADFATMVSLQRSSGDGLRSTVERFARTMVRARVGMPRRPFVESSSDFGRFKQLVVRTLMDPGSTPAKEQACKAADCCFAHLMKPSEGSTLRLLLNEPMSTARNGACFHEALAAATLNANVEEVRQLDMFCSNQPPDAITTGINNTAMSRTTSLGASTNEGNVEPPPADDEAVESGNRLDAKIEKLSREVNSLKKQTKKSSGMDSLDAGGGLVYADPREQYKDQVNDLVAQGMDHKEQLYILAEELARVKEERETLREQMERMEQAQQVILSSTSTHRETNRRQGRSQGKRDS